MEHRALTWRGGTYRGGPVSGLFPPRPRRRPQRARLHFCFVRPALQPPIKYDSRSGGRGPREDWPNYVVCARDRSAACRSRPPICVAARRRSASDTNEPNARWDVYAEGRSLLLCRRDPRRPGREDSSRAAPCLGAPFERPTGRRARSGRTARTPSSGTLLSSSVSDVFASRTVWYVHDEQRSLASTSQRALGHVLGDFAPRPETATWMMAAGQPRLERPGRAPAPPAAAHEAAPRPRDVAALGGARRAGVRGARSHPQQAPRGAPRGGSPRHARASTPRTCARRSRSPAAATAARCWSVWRTRQEKPPASPGPGGVDRRPDFDDAIARDLARRFGMEHEYLHLDLGRGPAGARGAVALSLGRRRCIEDLQRLHRRLRRLAEALRRRRSARIIRGDCPGWRFRTRRSPTTLRGPST